MAYTLMLESQGLTGQDFAQFEVTRKTRRGTCYELVIRVAVLATVHWPLATVF